MSEKVPLPEADPPCECSGPGFCRRYKQDQSEYAWRVCAEKCTAEFPCSAEKSRRYRKKWAQRSDKNFKRKVREMKERARLGLPAASPPEKKRKIITRGRCAHLGEPTGEVRLCKSCNKVESSHEIYACSLHGKCALTKSFGDIPTCRTCGDFKGEIHTQTLSIGRVLQVESTSPLATRVIRVDSSKLAGSADNTHFNASLIRWQGKLLLAYRTLHSGSKLHISRLDEDYVPQDFTTLEIAHPACASGADDPRFFVHQGHLYLSFVGVERASGVTRTSQMYLRLDDKLRVSEVFAPEYPARQEPMEKNWAFFEHKRALHCVYSIAPYRILRVDKGQVTLAGECEAFYPWTGGLLRGGASPVLVQGLGKTIEYWHFFHGREDTGKEGMSKGHRYTVGVSAFEAKPPFRPTRITPEPIIIPSQLGKKKLRGNQVVFVCGAILENQTWKVSYGVDDTHIEIAEIPHAAIEKVMVTL